MNRRQILAAAGGAAAVLGGGVWVTRTSTPPVGLGSLFVANGGEETVEAQLRVEKADEVVFDQVLTVDAADGRDVEERWLGERVDYEITATAGDDSKTLSTADVGERWDLPSDSRCLDVIVEVGDPMGIFATSERCSRPGTPKKGTRTWS